MVISYNPYIGRNHQPLNQPLTLEIRRTCLGAAGHSAVLPNPRRFAAALSSLKAQHFTHQFLLESQETMGTVKYGWQTATIFFISCQMLQVPNCDSYIYVITSGWFQQARQRKCKQWIGLKLLMHGIPNVAWQNSEPLHLSTLQDFTVLRFTSWKNAKYKTLVSCGGSQSYGCYFLWMFCSHKVYHDSKLRTPT